MVDKKHNDDSVLRVLNLAKLWARHSIEVSCAIITDWAKKKDIDVHRYFELLFSEILPEAGDVRVFFENVFTFSLLMNYKPVLIIANLIEAADLVREQAHLETLADVTIEFADNYWKHLSPEWISNILDENRRLGECIREAIRKREGVVTKVYRKEHGAIGYAVVIGITDYHKTTKLPTAVRYDAEDMTALFISADYCSYPFENVKLLLNEEATIDEIRNAMGWLAKNASENHTIIFFFSGHGGWSEKKKESYLLPVNWDPTKPVDTSISSVEFMGFFDKLKAKRILTIFDCCHAGGIGSLKSPEVEDLTFKFGVGPDFYDKLAQGTGRAIMASSRPDEKSGVKKNARNSIFTGALLEALRGQAHTAGDGLIRVFDVFNYISKRVREQSKIQHPQFKTETEDNFPISLYLGGKRPIEEIKNGTTNKSDIDKVRLIKVLQEKYPSKEELELFCFRLEEALKKQKGLGIKVSPDRLGGERLGVITKRLVELCEKYHALATLIVELNKDCPGAF